MIDDSTRTGNRSPRQVKPSNPNDFADTLGYAEVLLSALEAGRQRRRWLLVLMGTLALVSITIYAFAIVIVVAGHWVSFLTAVLLTITVVITAGTLQLWVLEVGRGRRQWLLVLTATLAIASVIIYAFAISIVVAGHGVSFLTATLLTTAVIITAVTLQMWLLIVRPLTLRLRREERSITELLGMLRELLPLLQEDESMSFVQYQTFKTRVSRFPVTPGKTGRGR